jgi:hypothetical protein
LYRTQAGVVLRGGTRFLLRAGLLLLLQALLRDSDDTKQCAVIERNIQQLWLIETKATPQ